MLAASLISSIVSTSRRSSSSFSSSVMSPYLAEGTAISAGKTDSQPYTSEKGVCPVAPRGVVLLAHKILGSSSTHFPLADFNRLFIPLIINLLLDSACSLAYGYLGVDMVKVMFHFRQKSLVLLLMNCEPLSQTILLGTPNLQIMLVQINEITSLSLTWGKASASIHFEK